MKKVIINSCYGGYGWSNEAIREYLTQTTKGADIREGNGGMYVNGLFFWGGNICRTDSVAIALLEEKGSEFCSGPYSSLKIAEYDDEYFEYDIDEYNGIETLKLIHLLSEDRIRSCSSMDEVVELLRKCNVIR